MTRELIISYQVVRQDSSVQTNKAALAWKGGQARHGRPLYALPTWRWKGNSRGKPWRHWHATGRPSKDRHPMRGTGTRCGPKMREEGEGGNRKGGRTGTLASRHGAPLPIEPEERMMLLLLFDPMILMAGRTAPSQTLPTSPFRVFAQASLRCSDSLTCDMWCDTRHMPKSPRLLRTSVVTIRVPNPGPNINTSTTVA